MGNTGERGSYVAHCAISHIRINNPIKKSVDIEMIDAREYRQRVLSNLVSGPEMLSIERPDVLKIKTRRDLYSLLNIINQEIDW